MRPTAVALAVVVVLGAAGLQGCAASEPESGARVLPSIKIGSPALSGIYIPKAIACKRRSIWLPLRWDGVPKSAGELVLAITFSEFEHPSASLTRATVRDVAVVGGLRPSRGGLSVGPLPEGAFIESHTRGGYCPGALQEAGAVFTLFALPRGHHFDPSESVALTTVDALEEVAVAAGVLSTVYGTGYG